MTPPSALLASLGWTGTQNDYSEPGDPPGLSPVRLSEVHRDRRIESGLRAF
mgnify:CR=1 FL=1